MNEVRHIVIAGRSPVAWIAAAGLLRAFQHRPPRVTVIDTGESESSRAGYWTLPSQRGIHTLLGVSESAFIKQTGASFKLATEHNGWQGAGSRFLHVHGDIGIEFRGTPFYKFLQGEALAGRPQLPENFSVGGIAATLGKFARPMEGANALTANFTYGFHLDEGAYTAYLRAHAERLGAHAAPAAFAGVSLNETGDIASITLADGSSLTADLFLDCSGREARLIGAVDRAGRDDWSSWLPCDGMWSAKAPASADPPAITRTFATDAGWLWRAPLARSSMAGHVFSSRFQDADAALAVLRAFEPGLDTPHITRFVAGRRRQFWERNCVAIGASAVELEPLAGADLHLAQIGIATLVELFPRDASSVIEAAEYNRLMAEYSDALRDFTLAHYHVCAPRAGAFWSDIRTRELPANLAAKLSLYAANGRIDVRDHETFEEVDWAWLFMGAGVNPDSIEMQTRLQLADLPLQEVAAMRAQIQRLAQSMPSHAEFLRHLASASPRSH